MKPGRDRFGPVMFLVMAALLLFALFLTPGVQAGEMDTGPQLVTLELVSHPAATVLPAVLVDIVDQAGALNSYCIENESQVEITAVIAISAEAARYESAVRSAVGRSCADDLSRDDMLVLDRPGAPPHPLRI